MQTRTGYSLLELTLVLALGGILLLLATPPLHHARDIFATRAARDYVLGQLALARTLAPAYAGTEVVLVPAAAELGVRSTARLHTLTSLRERFGVELGLSGAAADTVALRFDAIGLGRMANRTLAFTRGRASARISISTYGRARPW